MSKHKHFAVILSGCGVFDGAEVHESVFTLWAIAKSGCTYQIFAPDISQAQVINHLTGDEMIEKRNVLIEAARIARGNIKPLSELSVNDFDILIFPGGFGVAKNLCTFAFDGDQCIVNKEVENIIKEFYTNKKPIGALCISPALVTRVLNEGEVTIGSDIATANAIESMGGKHVKTNHEEVIIDKRNLIVTSPCYMLDANIIQIANSAEKVINEIIKLSNQK